MATRRCATTLGIRGATPDNAYQLEWSPRDFNRNYKQFEKASIKQYALRREEVVIYRKVMEMNTPEARAMLQRLKMTPAEVRAKILEGRKAVSSMTASKQKYFNTSTGKYNAERTKLHKKGVNQFVSKTAEKGKEALFTGGIPGSGKSTVLQHPKVNAKYKNAVKLDPDDMKAFLAKADGINTVTTQAAIYHEESVDLYVRCLERALKRGNKVILDSTMRTESKVMNIINQVKGKGYKVDLVFANLPIEKAMLRGIERYVSGGRFVDPIYIATHDAKNIKVFEKLKPQSNTWRMFSTDVAYGKPAKIASQGVSKGLPITKRVITEKYSDLDMYWAINDGEEILYDALGNCKIYESCYFCKHFDQEEQTCPAFDIIPNAIITGQEVHYRKVEGQNGDYVFTQDEA